MQIGEHQFKIVNVTENTTIFLRDITCLNRIQAVLRLYEEGKLSKITFSKSKAFMNWCI